MSFVLFFVLLFVSPPAYLLVVAGGGSCGESSDPDYLIYALLMRLRLYYYARTIVRLRLHVRLLRMLHVCPGRPKRRPMYVVFG